MLTSHMQSRGLILKCPASALHKATNPSPCKPTPFSLRRSGSKLFNFSKCKATAHVGYFKLVWKNNGLGFTGLLRFTAEISLAGHGDPSIQIMLTLGPKVCKYYLHWAKDPYGVAHGTSLEVEPPKAYRHLTSSALLQGLRYLKPKSRACGTGRPGRRALAHPALVTWNVFLGLKTLFSLVKLKAAKSGIPIVLMMFLYEARARAPRTGTSAAQLGPLFSLIGTRRGQKPK